MGFFNITLELSVVRKASPTFVDYLSSANCIHGVDEKGQRTDELPDTLPINFQGFKNMGEPNWVLTRKIDLYYPDGPNLWAWNSDSDGEEFNQQCREREEMGLNEMDDFLCKWMELQKEINE